MVLPNNQPSMEQAKRSAASGGSQPSMERQQMAPSAPWSAKRPPAAMPAPVAVEAPPTPRVPTTAPATRPATATATRPARDIQGSMESAGAQQAQRSAASAGFA